MSAKGYILENKLPSELYARLLEHINGISQYGLAKERYGDKFHGVDKAYSVFNELVSLNLISREKLKSKRDTFIIKPNILEFLKVLSERKLPQEKQLDSLDRERLAELLRNGYITTAFSSLSSAAKSYGIDDQPVSESSPDILSAIAIALKFGNFMGMCIQNLSEEKAALLGNPNIEQIYKSFKPFKELPLETKEKLTYLKVPDFFEVSLQSANALLNVSGPLLSDLLKGLVKSSKKRRR